MRLSRKYCSWSSPCTHGMAFAGGSKDTAKKQGMF